MAEVLLRNRIAERFGWRPDELEQRGVVIVSAGIAAMAGGRPTAEAVAVMAERGLDLSEHQSQPVTERLVRQADLILAMTRSHREAIAVQWPGAAERTWVLSRDGADVADPIGGSRELYARCADQIDEQLREHVSDWDFDLPFPVGLDEKEGY
jgi:protein-tyrosine phosphatase